MAISILSKISDNKINALNVLIQISVKEYLSIATDIIDKNEMQRKKIKSSRSVYSLLRNDLRQGCTIPPICLAIRKEAVGKQLKLSEIEKISDADITKLIQKKQVIILDGLQRTYQLLELEAELKKQGETDVLRTFHNRPLRAEIFIGVNKIGILYRMLTLNTGQTPMSVRHQIEILYQDYIGDNKISGVKLLKEVDGSKSYGVGKYKFNEIIDGFQSYLEKDELAIDKSSLLEDVKSLEKLSKVGQKKELFLDFVLTYHSYIEKIVALSTKWSFDKESDIAEKINQPYGNSALEIFCKGAVLTGFGAAIGTLEDTAQIKDFDVIIVNMKKLKLGGDSDEVFTDLIEIMDKIRTTSKKIGNSQRRYFYYFFKSLFNPELDSYLNIHKTIHKAFQTYKVEFL